MDILIKNGRVIDPANHMDKVAHVVLKNGKISAVTEEIPQGDFFVIDAENRVVCPGFVDIHMHEAPVADLGDLDHSVLGNMARMGVTTCLGGNCGELALPPKEYFRQTEGRLPVNLALMAGHGDARRAAGFTDKYAALTDAEIKEVTKVLADWLDQGCFGISYGIRYVPGITARELTETASLCRKDHLLLSAHVRDDADFIFSALDEFLFLGKDLDLPCQVSHIGSMGGYGQMAEVLKILEREREKGLDVMADCYPYSAFSTRIGAATYDPGFLERYRCGYDTIILCGGKYHGKSCTEEIFQELRREAPETITVAHVMRPEEVQMALCHPLVMLGSDGDQEQGAGHPRAAGAFPRLIGSYVRPGYLTLYGAIEKMTTMAARRLGLKNKGNLTPGSDGDVVIFDPETIGDNATFESPTLPPSGMDYVLINGRIACRDGVLVNGTLGRALLRT